MQLIYKNKPLDAERLTSAVANPNAGQRTSTAEYNAPGTEPVAVTQGGAQPAADEPTDSNADKNHKLHEQ